MSDIWMQTLSGVKFDLLDPQPEMVKIGDILNGLHYLVRFTGQSRVSITVAQHSVLVGRTMVAQNHGCDEARLLRLGFLHDAHEAYTGDVSTPMAAAIASASGGFKLSDIKDRIQRAIHISLDVDMPTVSELNKIRRADLSALRLEASLTWSARQLSDWTVPGGMVHDAAILGDMPSAAIASHWMERELL